MNFRTQPLYILCLTHLFINLSFVWQIGNYETQFYLLNFLWLVSSAGCQPLCNCTLCSLFFTFFFTLFLLFYFFYFFYLLNFFWLVSSTGCQPLCNCTLCSLVLPTFPKRTKISFTAWRPSFYSLLRFMNFFWLVSWTGTNLAVLQLSCSSRSNKAQASICLPGLSQCCSQI